MTVNTQAPARGRLVGSFRFVTATQRWAWSDEVARMHVYEPDSVVRSTKLVLSHKHPHDKAYVAALIDDAIQYGPPFSSRHRIIDAEGLAHVVVVVGDLLYDEKEQVIATAGFYIDITDAHESNIQDALEDASYGAESSSDVEWVRGILMFVYNLSAEQAMGVLGWRAKKLSIGIEDLSAKFVREVTSEDVMSDPLRRHVDHVLQRIRQGTADTAD
jgi:PAS fold